MDAGAVAQLPHAGVRLVVELEGLLAGKLQLLEVVRAGGREQALVEKGLRGAEHQIAIGVVLEMLIGLVADADRAVAAIALQLRQDALGELMLSSPTP